MKDSDWEILYALYKKPNITKVANMLFMTQPSLTKRLQQMEKEYLQSRMNHSVSPLDNPAQLTADRRMIARVKTELRRRELNK